MSLPDRGTFVVSRGDGREIASAGRRRNASILSRAQQTTEAAIHTTWLSDIYAVLGERDDTGAWATRLYYNPLVPWIWAGCIVMALGGMVSLTDRRLRVGAPRRARTAGGPVAAGAAAPQRD